RFLRKTEYRDREADLCHPRRRTAPRRWEILRAANFIRNGSSGARPALLHRCWQSPRRTRLGAKGKFRNRAPQDSELVSDKSGMGQKCHQRSVPPLDFSPIQRESRRAAKGSFWRADRGRAFIL